MTTQQENDWPASSYLIYFLITELNTKGDTLIDLMWFKARLYKVSQTKFYCEAASEPGHTHLTETTVKAQFTTPAPIVA